MKLTVGLVALCLLLVAESKDTTCNGMMQCGCYVVNQSLTGCNRNAEVAYLHELEEAYGYPVYGIAENAFMGMGRTKELHLTGNKILYIHPKAFQGLINLKFLSLSNNFLANLHPDTFKNLRQLEYLSLSGNPDAVCPATMDLCSDQNLTKFPCCTEKKGNVEELEKLKVLWDEQRSEYEAKMNATKAAASTNATNSSNETNTSGEDGK